jgi:hypothetical protein
MEQPIQFEGYNPNPLRGWGSAEYLGWWVRGQHAPGPLVTTGDPASPSAGILIDGSTRVLYGDRTINYSAASGGRFTLGMWLGSDSVTGIELTAFYLQPRDTRFQATSDPTGLPILAIPFETSDGNPAALYAASNGVQVANVHGSISILTSTRLLGAELNTVFNAWRDPSDVLELVIGLRYLDLQESYRTHFSTAFVNADGNAVGNDSFNTRNHFAGVQVGARWKGGVGPWSASIAGLLALGGTCQTVAIDGNTTIAGTALTPASVPGLLYSQPSNIGQHRHSTFSAVPQVQVKLGYNILRNVRLTIGYDFLCWTGVMRAADQIDTVVNVSQTSPTIFPGGNLNLVGPGRPAAGSETSTFWAQGVSGGVEFSW